MGDTIKNGTEVQLVAASRPRRGEVWAYVDDEGRIVVHRFVGRRRRLLVFRGDAIASTDLLVAETRLAGKVVSGRDGEAERQISRRAGLVRIGRWKAEGVRRRLARRFRQSP